MSIKGFIAALVLGTSSIAAAATPAQPIEHATLPPLGVGFLRHVVEAPAPMVLANDTRVAGSFAISKISTLRPFSKLELRANDGRTTVDRVVLHYANGKTRIVKLKRAVYGSKAVTIDVADASAIKRIVVVGSSKRGSSIDVFAS